MRRIFFMAVVFSAFASQAARACTSCYGAADNPMVDGMNAAIFGMLGITGFVLSGVVAFALMMRHRTNSKKSDHTVIDSQENTPWKNS